MYSKLEQQWLLSLARETIALGTNGRRPYEIVADQVSEALCEKRACFVTLTIRGQLRGCIGHLEAIQPLYKDVMENASAAAFGDPRFPPLEKGELEGLRIEISVLTPPKPLAYKGAGDLVRKLHPGKDGVILGKGANKATFLPQVWDEIRNPEDFLSHLSAKAGLAPDAWRKGDLSVEIYGVEAFEEEQNLAKAG